jgi:hypothetical protein
MFGRGFRSAGARARGKFSASGANRGYNKTFPTKQQHKLASPPNTASNARNLILRAAGVKLGDLIASGAFELLLIAGEEDDEGGMRRRRR